jgi:hypothetical protein
MVSSVLYRRWLYRRNEDWFVFLGIVSVGLFWLLLLVTTIINSSLLSWVSLVETESLLLAVFYPLAYPFWFCIGGWSIFFFFGRRPDQGGVYWLYRINDRTEEFDPSWDS